MCENDSSNILVGSKASTSNKLPRAKRKKPQNAKQKNKKAKTGVLSAQKEKINFARLPKSSTDLSSNWKRLLQQMEEQKQKNSTGSKSNSYARSKAPIKTAQTNMNKQNKMSEHNPLQVKEKKAPEIWFDDVDECLLDQNAEDDKLSQTSSEKSHPLVKDNSFKGFTKAIAMDCEMVGVGYKGDESVLARVSLVNHFGNCVYDKYVKPREKVTDYRTAVSGIRPEDVENANDFKVVQKEVSDIMNNRLLVGHAIRHDLKVLFLDHPKRMIRDTSSYKPFRAAFGGRTPSLKNLSARMLGVSVQQGEHSSVQDAQAAMRLYTMFRKDWEKDFSLRKNKAQSAITRVSESSDQKGKHNVHQNVVNNKGETMSTLDVGFKRSNRLVYEDSD